MLPGLSSITLPTGFRKQQCYTEFRNYYERTNFGTTVYDLGERKKISPFLLDDVIREAFEND